MKKEYIQPKIKVVETKAKLTLLVGSGQSLGINRSYEYAVDEDDEL